MAMYLCHAKLIMGCLARSGQTNGLTTDKVSHDVVSSSDVVHVQVQ
jgi:hypothetical protein